MLGEWNQTSPGGGWAMYDPELAQKYPGKYVVALPNQVIEVGDDEAEVRARAAEKLGLPVNDVCVVQIAPLETRVPIRW
ncbi:MAG: DUF5678 domain-containing protein [Planctomycetia bacterium]|nr:DUF5678 domain-containing protein [Planctomycetia bacterium]